MLKSARYHYYSLFPSIRGKLSCKKSALVWHEILRMFVNTLTTADKYYRSKIQNLQQQFQNPLPQKQNTIFGFFIPFLKCAWSLEHFQNKDEYPSLIISEVIDPERRRYLHV